MYLVNCSWKPRCIYFPFPAAGGLGIHLLNLGQILNATLSDKGLEIDRHSCTRICGLDVGHSACQRGFAAIRFEVGKGLRANLQTGTQSGLLLLVLQFVFNCRFRGLANTWIRNCRTLHPCRWTFLLLAAQPVASLIDVSDFMVAVRTGLVPTFLVPVAVVAFGYYVVNPFILEAYFNPSNSMAPTLLGQHFEKTCEECSEPSYTTALPFRRPNVRNWICQNYHVTESETNREEAEQPDRFIVLKFMEPKRWDIVAFKSAQDPGENYTARLVGLPGETVWIKDGKLIADGTQLDMPAELEGLNYESEIEFIDQEFWGTEENPAKLGADEYFVLGDYSQASMDSRLWTRGVPGHPPYALPKSNVIGVATHIYWPISRWRAFK